jgi:outer membrane protein assembly factor BamB
VIKFYVSCLVSLISFSFSLYVTKAFASSPSSQSFGASGALVEVISASPTLSGIPYLSKATTRPQRVWASFGGVLDPKSFSTSQLGRYGVSRFPLVGTVLEPHLNVSVVPFCGGSPALSSLSCYNLVSGEFLSDFPIPGALSTQPIFFDGSWLFGTTKGFFIRTFGTSLQSTPLLGGEHVGFWGGAARRMMKGMKPRASIDGPEKPTDPLAVYRNSQREGWKWFVSSGYEFIGTPVVFGTQVYVLTANQYLLALDSETGRSLWSVRLAPETNLRISGSPLVATAKEVLVGTDDGHILALSPKDGSVVWRHMLPVKGTEQFKGIVATPLTIGRSVVFSNAENLTQRLSLDGKTLEWEYAEGSVAQVRSHGASVYLGTQKGTIVSLDLRTGALQWKMAVSPESPIASIYLATQKGVVIAANKKGALFALDLQKGTLIASTPAVGEVVGEFIPGVGESDACLSYAQGGFRCYSMQRSSAVQVSQTGF